MLGKASITGANSDVAVYTVPTGKRASFILSLCNRTTSDVKACVALCAAGTSPSGDGSNFIEFNVVVPANQAYERTGLVLKAGQICFVRCNVPSALTAVTYGIEE